MNYIFSYGCFSGFMIALGVAIMVIVRNHRDKLNRSFFLSAVASGLYNLSAGLFFLNGDLAEATFFHRSAVDLWVVFIVVQLYFTMVLARAEGRVLSRILLGLTALLSPVFMVFVWLGSTIYQVPIANEFLGWQVLPGRYYYYLTAFSLLIAVMQFSYIIVARKKSESQREKYQVSAVLVGLMVGSLIGVCFDLVALVIGLYTQSFVWLTSIVYVCSFGYAMMKFGFLEVTPSDLAENIVETMPDFLIFADTNERIRLVNQNYLRVFGYAANEVLGGSFADLRDNDRETLRASLDRAGFVAEQEMIFLKKSGAKVPVVMSALLVKDQFGDEGGYLCIFRDVSVEKNLLAEQGRMIEKLTAAKAKMTKLLAAEEQQLQKVGVANADLGDFQMMAAGREQKLIELEKELARLKGEEQRK